MDNPTNTRPARAQAQMATMMSSPLSRQTATVAGPETLVAQALDRPLHQLGQVRVGGGSSIVALHGDVVAEEGLGPVESLDDRADPTGIATHERAQPRFEDEVGGCHCGSRGPP